MSRKRLIVTDDTGRGWVVLPNDPGFIALDILKKLGYDITKVGIPREILLGNPPNPVEITPDLSLEELRGCLSDLGRRDLQDHLGSRHEDKG